MFRIIRPVNRQRGVILILNSGYQLLDPVPGIVDERFQAFQVVGRNPAHPCAHQLGHAAAGVYLPVLMFPGVLPDIHQRRHRVRHIHRLQVDFNRIRGQRIPLYPVDIIVHPVRQAHDQCDADNPDGSGKCRQESPSLLGQQVVQAQSQCCPEAHGRFLFPLPGFRLLHTVRLPAAGIAYHFPVQQPDRAGRVFFRQVRVMGDHNHQLVPGDLPQDVHHLQAGFAVQRAGRFIRQQDIRVVHQCPGNCHPLHLAAAHLVGAFLQLVSQSDPLQHFRRAPPPFLPAHAGKRQRQFHVGQHCLVRNQVVALEYKSDRMIPVYIPVLFPELFRAPAVDQQIARRIPVQSADDIQQGGLPASGRTENGSKLTFPEFQIDSAQGFHLGIACRIILCNSP